MSSKKARFFFHVYYLYENKEKHVGDAKLGDYTTFSASSAPLREDILGKIL